MDQENRQQMTEYEPIKTTSQMRSFDLQVIEASKGVKILYETDLRSKFKQLFAKINIILGGSVESLPKDAEIEVLLNYALDHWSAMTIPEIEMAVNANISRKTADFIPFYGKISAAYIQACIAAYNEIKRKSILEQKRRQESERPNTQHDPDYIVNSKLYDGLVDFVRGQGYFPQYWDFGSVHEHMTTNSLIAPWSNDQKRKVFDAVKTLFISGKAKAKVMASTIQDIRDADSFDDDSKVKAECRKIQVLCTILPEQGAKHLQELGVDI